MEANALHGLKRSNADKRRCVEIALKEFGHLANEAIAEMIGIPARTIGRIDSTSDIVRPDRRTGRDGKQYPAKRERRESTITFNHESAEGQLLTTRSRSA